VLLAGGKLPSVFVVGAGLVVAAPAGLPPRTTRLMSRSALLAAGATRAALADAGWREGLEDVGFFMGVGASTADLEALVPAIAQAASGGSFLDACPPLHTFQLLPSFTLSHAAILEGIGGPTGVFYGDAVVALAEAIQSILDGDCSRALAGAADSALHPLAERVASPSEGAAILALSASPQGARATVALEAIPRGAFIIPPVAGALVSGPALAWCAALRALAEHPVVAVPASGGVAVFRRAP
jgi:hypothetical protein